MSFHSISIKEAMNKIAGNRLLLPAIQRKFVWFPDQITLLFDSLMQGYPIGTFLFWELSKDNSELCAFHQFSLNYKEDENKPESFDNKIIDEYNKEDENKPESFTPEMINDYGEFFAVLDGQQRLTALRLGLRGSYTYEIAKQGKQKQGNAQKRYLYLNIAHEFDTKIDKWEGDYPPKFNFQFLTDDEAERATDKDHYWYKVQEISNIQTPGAINKFVRENLKKYTEENQNFATDAALSSLLDLYNQKISYFKIDHMIGLEEVLEIFTRVNTGGTKLESSDLFESRMTSIWGKTKNATEEIGDLVKSINEKFNINKDLVLKAALLLSGYPPSLTNFVNKGSKDTIRVIKDKWDEIKVYIENAFNLIADFGFSKENFTANQAALPIAYYLMKLSEEKSKKIELKDINATDRSPILKWLCLSIVNGVFGEHADGELTKLRKIVDDNVHDKTLAFPLDAIISKSENTKKSLVVTPDTIEGFMELDIRKEKPKILAILNLISDETIKGSINIDHIYPKANFEKKKYLQEKGLNLNNEQLKEYKRIANCLPNLQLLTEHENKTKLYTDFADWIDKEYPPNSKDREMYLRTHCIPAVPDVVPDYTYPNFITFIKERKKLLIQRLESILRYKSVSTATGAIDK